MRHRINTQLINNFLQTDSHKENKSDMITNIFNSGINNVQSSLNSTNFIYNCRYSKFKIPFLCRQNINIIKQLFLLGNKYSDPLQFQNRFKKIVWFSYRQNIPVIGDDRGWGCMIRSGQMLMAQILRQYLKYHKKKFISPQQQDKQIINQFVETFQAKFSILNLCKKKSYEFFSSLQVCYLLQQLLQINQQQYPYLKLQIQRDSIINADQIYKQVFIMKNDLVIIIHTKLSLGKMNESDFQIIKKIMRNKNFLGALGGIGNQGLFIVGYQQNTAIILDPHYVNQSHTQYKKQLKNEYFKQFPKGIKLGDLCSSFSFAFYLNNEQDCKDFVRMVQELQNNQNSILALKIEDKTRQAFNLKQNEETQYNISLIIEKQVENYDQQNMMNSFILDQSKISNHSRNSSFQLLQIS